MTDPANDEPATDPLAPLEAKARALRAQKDAAHRTTVLREAAAAIQDFIDRDRARSAVRSNDRAALGAARQIVLGLIDGPAATIPTPAPAARAALSAAERTMLTYALNQAQLRIWSVGGVTDQEQAAVISLRRLADAAPGPGRADGEPQQAGQSTADRAAELGLTNTEYRARSHATAVAAVRAAIPGMYAHIGHRLEDALNEAGEPQQDETPAASCAHCGKTIRCVTGTLAAWWVHEPDGSAACLPQQGADSPRAEPKPAAASQPFLRLADDQDGCYIPTATTKRPPMDPVHILGIGSDEDSSALRAALLSRQQPPAGTACSDRPCNAAADELCDNHVRIKYHADGEHAFCGPECTEEA